MPHYLLVAYLSVTLPNKVHSSDHNVKHTFVFIALRR